MNTRWLVLGVVAFAASAQAGTVVHINRHDFTSGASRPSTVIYAQNGWFRMDTLDIHGNVSDFTLVRDGQIWQVDVNKRTFYHFNQAALAGQRKALQAQMQAELQQLPAAQRAKMEAGLNAMIQRAQQAKFSATATGRSERVGSWSCKVWQEQRNGKTTAEICFASPGALPGGRELVEASRKAAETTAEVMGSLPETRAASAQFAMFGTANGFPVRTRYLDNGKPEDEETVTSIEVHALPADKFEIPKGFTQTTIARAESGDD